MIEIEENKLKNKDIDDDDDVHDKLCKICKKENSKYTCPRCGIDYCSLVCYKSDNHSDCSESFYKHCVEEELKSEENDPETRIKMLEILKRIHEEQENDIEDIENLAEYGLDSDDDDEEEEETQDLAQRLENVDLDDADKVWSLLTDSEKNDFENLLKNGDVKSFLPVWKPWWSYKDEKKLIKDLDKREENFDYKKNSPNIKEAKPYNQISKIPPADCVKNNLLNVLHAYVFTVLYFNGEQHDFPKETVSLILKLSKNFKENEIFFKSDLAIESVSQQALNCQSLITDPETLSAMKNACISILQGPNDNDQSFYIKAALSDIHELLTKVKSINKLSKIQKNNDNLKKKNEFSKRFPDHDDISDSQLPTNQIRLCIKKIDYYLSWVECYANNNFYAYNF